MPHSVIGISADEAEAEQRISIGLYEEAAPYLERLEPYVAALQRARIGYMTSTWDAALHWAEIAREGASAVGDAYREGRALHIGAEALSQQGRRATVGARLERAVTLLRATEDGRFRACAENEYGWYLYGEGRQVEARTCFDSAYHTALGHGVIRDAIRFGQSRLYVEYDEGRYTEVLRRTVEYAEMAGDDPGGLAYVLRIRTLCYLALVDDGAARRAADAYEASGAGDAWDLLAAPLLTARAAAVAGERGALARLPALLARVAETGNTHWLNVASLWVWAALVVADPVAACRRRDELYLPATVDQHPITQIERRVIDRTWHPIVLDFANPAIFESTNPPSEVAEAATYLSAFRHANGSARAMARLLGRSRAVVVRQMRELGLSPEGAPGRPRRAD